MENQIAYIDEFGNFGFDFEKEGVSTHFIVASVIIDSEKLKQNEEILEKIRKAEFQKGEIKSSLVSKNIHRRKKVLTLLNAVDYHIFAFVIDKRKLISEGFKYKQPFYKFLHSLVDRELFKTFPNLQIVADEHGSKDFMSGFVKYIEKRHIPDLFNQSDFRFSNSKSELMVQLADFISGTLSVCYDEKKLADNPNQLFEIIREKIIDIRFWPKDYIPFAYDPQHDFQEFDMTIANLARNLSIQFIQENDKKPSPAEIDQVNCLRYLLFYFQSINPNKYVPTHEIMDQINSFRSRNMSMHYFRSKIIAKLRDSGVIIASGNLGYKLPANVKDLYEYFNHTNTYVQPMISRLLKCRERVKMATKNDIDLFENEQFKFLKQLTDNIP
jgi:hypothetical protein